MTSDTSSIPQWTELGSQLSGPDADQKRQEILNTLSDLESKVDISMRSAEIDMAPRLQALQQAIETARELANSILKPVDLSAL